MITARPGSPAPVVDEESALETAELQVGGMHCSACATRIQGALAARPGVVSAAVNLATERAFVSYDAAATDLDGLCETVSGIGYTAEPASAATAQLAQDSIEHWPLRAAVSAVLALGALAIAMFGPSSLLAGWSVLVLAAVVEVVGGWPFLRTSARQLRHGATSMDTLIAIGTLAALAVSAVETIALGGRHVHIGGGGAFAAKLHGVMGPLIVGILASGRAVEERARQRAGRAMHSLLNLRPPVARVVRSVDDTDGTLVPPESIPVGALVRVRPGEGVPLDGTVVDGWSAVDESMLTGEPLPVDRGPDSQVTGGTRNGSGILVVRVGTIAAESVLARLQRIVEAAQRQKAPLQRVADRISSVFVPVILVASVATFLAWWLIGGDFGKAVLSAIALVLVACPCAMGLATPVAMMVGTGRASALGILIRNSDALERLAKVDVAAFDKTGTLTERSAQVIDATSSGLSRSAMLALAAAVEAESDHPIAAAIRQAATDAGAEPVRASEVTELPGVGIEGTVDGSPVRVVRHAGAAMPDDLATFVAAREGRGETVVVVQRGGETVGAIAVTTPLRPEAAAAIAHLRQMGIRSAILSGDSEAAVATAAAEVGADEAHGALTPPDKLSMLTALRAGSHHVVMVGDGINDAPALAAADVGCAVGSGTEAAIANSDVALLGSDLEGVPAAVGVARSTLAIIHQNFGWAMGYNVSALPLAAAGLLDPLIAAIAMGLSSLVVVLNSLRLTRLGRSGLDKVRAPRVMSRVRGVVLSVALPIVLFGGATVVGQVVSPARGQSLLPTLESIVTVQLPAGASAEVYLSPGTPGVNTFHAYFFHGGASALATGVTVTASRNGAAPEPVRVSRLSEGHFLAITVLAAGTWRFEISARVGGRPVHFGVDRSLA